MFFTFNNKFRCILDYTYEHNFLLKIYYPSYTQNREELERKT